LFSFFYRSSSQYSSSEHRIFKNLRFSGAHQCLSPQRGHYVCQISSELTDIRKQILLKLSR